MRYTAYKYVQPTGPINDPKETIYEIINREALEGNWKVNTFDFFHDRALLERLEENGEPWFPSGECTCQ